MDRRAAHRRAARQDPGRLQLDQWHDLQSRPARPISTTGRSAATAAGAMPTCCPISAAASSASAPGEADGEFRGARRRPADHRPRLARPDLRSLHRGRDAARASRATRTTTAREQAGVGYVQRTIQNGRRVSAARGLPEAGDARPNLTVRTHAHATAIDLRRQARRRHPLWQGRPDGTPMEVRARREVILSAGTVNTPQLLQVSGIGPETCWGARHAGGHALPGVGENCATTTPRASSCAPGPVSRR